MTVPRGGMFHLCSIKTSFFVCNAFAFHVVILDGICGIFRRTGDVGIGNSLWQCLTCRACIGIAGSLKIVGFDIDLLDKISDYLGFEYKLYPLSMKQIEQKIKNKEINLAIAGISITDERQRDYSFTDIYYETYLQIVVNKNADITDRKDVKNMAIGVVEGTSSEEYAKEYLAEDGNKIKVYKTAEEVFENLEADKIEATIYDASGIQSYMNTHKDTTNLEVLDEQLNSEESNYGIMFAKGYKYLDQFNVALQVLNNDGSYQKIKEQWIKTKE